MKEISIVGLDLARRVFQGKRSADDVGLEVPRHKGFNFGYRPSLSDARQGLGEPVERVDAVHFAGLQQGGQRGPCPSTALASGE